MSKFPYQLLHKNRENVCNVCKVSCPEAGPSLDMHYQGSTYLSLLDKRKEWGSMSSPFLTEPMALWEYISLHIQTQEYCKYSYKASHTPNSSQTVTAINGTEPSWNYKYCFSLSQLTNATLPHSSYTATRQNNYLKYYICILKVSTIVVACEVLKSSWT